MRATALRTYRELLQAAWVRMGRTAFDRLRAYKAEHGLRTLEDAIERLMEDQRA